MKEKGDGMKKNKKGFTLVEIIVVLVIIGILMALAVPAVMSYVRKAADT
ncbi:prepilin-type N-terminal cleavage/methylation domain-containing protein, partial [[Clostridium] innocuum]|nr:prepilin-type N-terminal cleavage/methylation domain-containing protein [[Clostridium] innocuum]